jgi:hypothetical protein
MADVEAAFAIGSEFAARVQLQPLLDGTPAMRATACR